MRGQLLPSGSEKTRRDLPKKLSSAAIILLLLALTGCGGQTTTIITTTTPPQNFQTLVNQPPDGAGLGFLLTDGTVVFQGQNETATNYPLVRITNQATGQVFYARTHDHSTMAVATGNAIVSTNFDVPAEMETGASALEVVANGIPSLSVSITVNSSVVRHAD